MIIPTGSPVTFWVIVRSTTWASPALCEILSGPVTETAVSGFLISPLKVSVTSVTGLVVVLLSTGAVLFSTVCAEAGAAGSTTASATTRTAMAADSVR
ncbi:hypothetical protein Pflav_001960 [Phytohabitans flavus]|uniref:Uncharacterized protein n=1 Tax=Phytohabitans flavus TaxID=1076124 RepID=A0A6F8XIZ8_9ACTN|nr:hypothetical protein [Phytohabitans flavus]BCB73786.1 hypothetical protein Pflav_001960 [Phytohabitans flavus]